MSVVFHIDDGDTDSQSELLGNLKNLREDREVDQEEIAVVLNGDAVDMVEKGSKAEELVKEELEQGVEFRACTNSLENRDVEELIEGVERASSGVGALTELQAKGYSYIKP